MSNHTSKRTTNTQPESSSPKKRASRSSDLHAPPPEPIASAEEVLTRKPKPRAPMPVELARMLEEETWWRVVPIPSAQPIAQRPKSANRDAAAARMERAVACRAASPKAAARQVRTAPKKR